MADWEYYSVQVDKSRGETILDALRNSADSTKAAAIDYQIDTGMLHSDTIADSAFVNAMGDSLGITTEYEDFEAETHNHTPHDYYTPTGPSDSPDVSGYISHDDRMDINQFMSETESDYVWVLKEQNRHGTEVTLHRTKQDFTPFLEEYDGYVEDMEEGERGWSGYFGNDSFHISCTQQIVKKAESEEGNAPIQDPMEFGEMANWTPLDGSEGLKRKRAETFEADFDYYYTSYDKGRGMEILDRLRTMNPETKAEALDWLIDNGYLHSEEVYDSAYINAMGDALYITSEEDEDDYDAEVRMPQPDSGTWTPSPYQSQFGQSSGSVGQIGTDKPSKPIMPKSFSAEYTGPSTLSSALSGARKTGKNGKHLTIIQRLVAKYGIEKGSKIYKHFGVKQKRASPKVRGKVRGTKSGPRRYSEGRVGGAGRSQVYQKGDRTGSWTPSGGHTTRFANSGKAWYQERGLGTPVAGPIPDTELAGKAMGQKRRGMFVNPAGIVGYPFVPAQQRERKSRK